MAGSQIKIDITGRRFGRLVVLRIAGHFIDTDGRRVRQWTCQCDCGAVIDTVGTRLRAGKAKSCGKCIRKDRPSPRLRHGYAKAGRVSPEYRAWINIKGRCFDPTDKSFATYGARGITMCREWADSFDAFIAAVGDRPSPKHSLDRIDNDRGYEPGNVRWATKKQQQNNTSRNVWIEACGRRQTLAQWADELGCDPETIAQRLQRGWPVARAVTEKAIVGRNQHESGRVG